MSRQRVGVRGGGLLLLIRQHVGKILVGIISEVYVCRFGNIHIATNLLMLKKRQWSVEELKTRIERAIFVSPACPAIRISCHALFRKQTVLPKANPRVKIETYRDSDCHLQQLIKLIKLLKDIAL